ncbi:metallophosphoesterase [Pirellula sp. SH-Sr6A]|uniref:metallophosphoesterase n=1 Tax=Pirellula sp. SH-Sr6A TaxID=1632865 RepID=UPI0014394BF3|nr:metallophosphoesterase [Pirellula sp. SH-Sr6A]
MLATLMLLAIAAIGHAGLVVTSYNVLNSTGLRRVTIKRLEKGILLLGIAIPAAILAWEIYCGDFLIRWYDFGSWQGISKVYAGLVAVFALVMAPFWLEARPQFAQAHHRESTQERVLWKDRDPHGKLIRGRKFARMAKLPRNEIAWTEANVKRLQLEGLPPDLIGLRIAHLSDIHLTGQMTHRYYHRAFDWIQSKRPELIVIAGDIVDYAHALDDMEGVLGGLEAPLGKLFVLGNHDKRLADPSQVCERMDRLGWIDVGCRIHRVQRGNTTLRLVGNERPWFQRTDPRHRDSEARGTSPTENEWVIGVSHSPDQFQWGVQMGCRLLLCGHTHGGQIRFPAIGPVVAPSWYGSRYASGVFEISETLMHVSRGLSGVHPYRWGCPPEVSILELHRDSSAHGNVAGS